MSDDQNERATLTREIAEMQEALETQSMRGFLEPLMTMDLTIQQLRVLMILVAEEEGGTGQAVAKSLGVSLATVSGIVDRLEAHGMVERVLDAHDQRVRRLNATPQGRRTIRDLLGAQTRVGVALLLDLETDDLRALAQGMRAILRGQTQPPSPTS
ncbi:MAG: MarR family transcriptional regulator [Microbacterium sp.]|uniref:MarR family winged helix-turn-helix transcriptional regulator n=1 Tax=Microbacterium sp. TaxID=51671 RepID=UPI0027165CD6|nr:MarR family transcriptional regulator [Microbacterium sp.]MDO8382017.1 MarR family transcriptional regulator [Microbacterium sp.]